MNIRDVDKELSKVSVKPNHIIMHPKAARKWDLFIKMWKRFLRGIGRKHRNL